MEPTKLSHKCPKTFEFPKRCATCETSFDQIEREIQAFKETKSAFQDEFLDKLKNRFAVATDFFEETSMDYSHRLHDQILCAKDGIDTRVESLKMELDILRDQMFIDLDYHEEVLLK